MHTSRACGGRLFHIASPTALSNRHAWEKSRRPALEEPKPSSYQPNNLVFYFVAPFHLLLRETGIFCPWLRVSFWEISESLAPNPLKGDWAAELSQAGCHALESEKHWLQSKENTFLFAGQEPDTQERALLREVGCCAVASWVLALSWLFQTNNLLLSLIYFYHSSTAKDMWPGSLIPFRAQRLLESSSLLNGDPQILPDPEPRSCPWHGPAQSSSPQILTRPQGQEWQRRPQGVCALRVCWGVRTGGWACRADGLALHANLALLLVFLLRVLSHS